MSSLTSDDPFAGLDEKIAAMQQVRDKIRKSKEMVGMYKRVNAAEQFVNENIAVIKEQVEENMTGLEDIQEKVRSKSHATLHFNLGLSAKQYSTLIRMRD